MAAGDAHRVWFPEMVEHLRLRWRGDLSMKALLRLRDELDNMLARIRWTRHISNPVFKCPACGHIGRGADPHVSVRATILALTRFGVAAREPARALEKAWSTYPPRSYFFALGFQFISSVIGAAALSSILLNGDWNRHHRARRAKVMQLLAIGPPGEDDGHRFH